MKKIKIERSKARKILVPPLCVVLIFGFAFAVAGKVMSVVTCGLISLVYFLFVMLFIEVKDEEKEEKDD